MRSFLALGILCLVACTATQREEAARTAAELAPRVGEQVMDEALSGDWLGVVTVAMGYATAIFMSAFRGRPPEKMLETEVLR